VEEEREHSEQCHGDAASNHDASAVRAQVLWFVLVWRCSTDGMLLVPSASAKALPLVEHAHVETGAAGGATQASADAKPRVPRSRARARRGADEKARGASLDKARDAYGLVRVRSLSRRASIIISNNKDSALTIISTIVTLALGDEIDCVLAAGKPTVRSRACQGACVTTRGRGRSSREISSRPRPRREASR
jgi:hypothetical protein